MNSKTVERIINEWDPIDLFPHAPSDEYRDEIEQILDIATRSTDVNQLASGIQQVFLKEFSDAVFKRSYKECLDIARQIMNVK